MRLIDADKLREDMLLALCGTGYQSIGLREIDFAPTIEAEPVRHGHWEGSECSVCHDDLLNYQYELPHIRYDYCPFLRGKDG